MADIPFTANSTIPFFSCPACLAAWLLGAHERRTKSLPLSHTNHCHPPTQMTHLFGASSVTIGAECAERDAKPSPSGPYECRTNHCWFTYNSLRLSHTNDRI